ncbi:MAG: metallophosphoesterase family protein [Asticcacaulis sp.]
MLSALKSLFVTPSKAPPSSIGRLTYGVGDIHGRADLFERMIMRIRADAEPFGERPLIVLLGDYVDRGPSSCQVLERILRLQQEDWCEVQALMGNHEEALLQFMREPGYGVSWVEYGGASTLASYGVAVPQMRTDPAAWEEARDMLLSVMPRSHLDLLTSLKVMLQVDDYLFVHAGVNPDVPLSEQGPQDFLWIRAPFLTSPKSCDYVVVHGHTPEDEPANERWRIGLDTGAYATGTLTAMRLRGDKRDVVQVR